ncbi:MAG: arylesterase, partial [Planctomycetota bacterium]
GDPKTSVQEKGPLVLFLGDSITAGLGVSEEEAYPAVIQGQLREAGLDLRVVNAGVSGDTTGGGLSRCDWLLKQGPKIVVLQLGANDAFRGQPVENVDSNLRSIIEKCRAAKARVLLLGMRIPPSYGKEYAESFDAVYPKLAVDSKVAFVPFFMKGVAGVHDFNQDDGIHPNVKGHVLLAKTVAPALKRLLEATP